MDVGKAQELSKADLPHTREKPPPRPSNMPPGTPANKGELLAAGRCCWLEPRGCWAPGPGQQQQPPPPPPTAAASQSIPSAQMPPPLQQAPAAAAAAPKCALSLMPPLGVGAAARGSSMCTWRWTPTRWRQGQGWRQGGADGGAAGAAPRPPLRAKAGPGESDAATPDCTHRILTLTALPLNMPPMNHPLRHPGGPRMPRDGSSCCPRWRPGPPPPR